jgi:hypothetical protein
MDHKWLPVVKTRYTGLKNGLPHKKYLSRGARSLSLPSRGTDATGELAVEISARGRDKPRVRNLLKVISRTILLGASN